MFRILILGLFLVGCSSEYYQEDVELATLAWDYGDSELYTHEGFYFFIENGAFVNREIVYADPYCLEPVTPYFEQDFDGKYIVHIHGNEMHYTNKQKHWQAFHYVIKNGYCDYQDGPMIGHQEYYVLFKSYRRGFL